MRVAGKRDTGVVTHAVLTSPRARMCLTSQEPVDATMPPELDVTISFQVLGLGATQLSPLPAVCVGCGVLDAGKWGGPVLPSVVSVPPSAPHIWSRSRVTS